MANDYGLSRMDQLLEPRRSLGRRDNYGWTNPIYFPQVQEPELPETAIARREPLLASDLLIKQAREDTYKDTMIVGCGLLNSYVNNLSQEKLVSVQTLEVNIERHENSLLKRLFSGEFESIEIDISVN